MSSILIEIATVLASACVGSVLTLYVIAHPEIIGAILEWFKEMASFAQLYRWW